MHLIFWLYYLNFWLLTDLILAAFSTLYKREFNLWKFMHLTFCLCQYLIWRTILFIKFYVSNSWTLLLSYAGESFTYQNSCIGPFAFVNISCEGEFYLARFIHLCFTYQDLCIKILSIKIHISNTLFLLISYAKESFIYNLLSIVLGFYLICRL